MDRTSRTHFGMDERGLGGTYMIQQQFLHMYRRIQSAEKIVDNDPPETSVFRRPTYYYQFGDYWKRVQPLEFQVSSKVDHEPPASFPLLKGLYINRPSAAQLAAERDKKLARQASKLPSNEEKELALLHATSIEGVSIDGMPESMVGYLKSLHRRREAVAEELHAIRKKRALRAVEEHVASETIHDCAGLETNSDVMIAALARDTLRSLDALASEQNVGADVVTGHSEAPNDAHTGTGGGLCEALQSLQGLALRSPAWEATNPVGEVMWQHPSNTRPSPLPAVGERRQSLAATRSQASLHTPTAAGSSAGASSPRSRRHSISNLCQLDPAILAASAPKRIKLRPGGTPCTRSPGNGAKEGSASSTPTPAHQHLVPRPPSSGVADVPYVSCGAPNTARGRYHIPLHTDSSMAGHVYDVIAAPQLMATASSPIVAPPAKTVGLLQPYDADEDAVTCDQHRLV